MIRPCCLVLVCISLVAVNARADNQADLARLRQRIAILQQEVEKTTETKSEVADELRKSERAISNSKRKLAQLTRQQQIVLHDLGQLHQRSLQLQQDMKDQRAQLANLLYRRYTEGQQEFMQTLLSNRNPNQAARNLQYYEYIMHGQAAWLVSLRRNLMQMDALTNQANLKNKEISSLRQEESSQRISLERDRLNRQQTLRKISLRLKQQNREVGRLQRNESRLTKLVEGLTQMFGDSAHTPFELLKGKLALPVSGKISNQFGVRRPDGTALWKGWFLRAHNGQEVRAIAAGRVVFSDWLRGFGNLLIIDHGKGYMSLYAYNETLYKQVGDVVNTGDVIATVGNSGGNENYGLYFELRHEGIPLNPARWIAAR